MARKITTDEKHRIRKQALFIKKLNDQRKKEGKKVTRFYRHNYKPEIYTATYEVIKEEEYGN